MTTSFDLANAEADLEPWIPSVEEIEALREERGISKTHLSEALGYTAGSGYTNGVAGGFVGHHRRLMALYAFHYFDHFGYLPIVAVK